MYETGNLSGAVIHLKGEKVVPIYELLKDDEEYQKWIRIIAEDILDGKPPILSWPRQSGKTYMHTKLAEEIEKILEEREKNGE